MGKPCKKEAKASPSDWSGSVVSPRVACVAAVWLLLALDLMPCWGKTFLLFLVPFALAYGPATGTGSPDHLDGEDIALLKPQPAPLEKGSKAEEESPVTVARQMYLETVMRSVAGLLQTDFAAWIYGHEKQFLSGSHASVKRRFTGEDAPVYAATMVGIRRLRNTQALIESVLQRNIPGDVMEIGVNKGGCALFMTAVLAAHNAPRTMYVADTFEPSDAPCGASIRAVLCFVAELFMLLPRKIKLTFLTWAMKHQKSFSQSEALADPDWLLMFVHHVCARLDWMTSFAAFHVDWQKDVRGVAERFVRFGLLGTADPEAVQKGVPVLPAAGAKAAPGTRVLFLKGFVEEVAPAVVPDSPTALSLIRVDVDTYDSTKRTLEVLYPRLSPGGFVIIDDYNSLPECKVAVDEFLAAQKHKLPTLVDVDALAVYWQKP